MEKWDPPEGKRIGGGTYCNVFESELPNEGGPCAKKVLELSKIAPQDLPEVRERFEREVSILASMKHPNIAEVLHQDTAAGRPYFLMPLYGPHLDKALRDCRGDADTVVPLFLQVCEAVHFAHVQAHPVIHRDLKPKNVLLTKDGAAVVADFGLGRYLGPATESDLTRTGHGLGTMPYIAPEQMRSARRADVRSDVYSLGQILYDMYAVRDPDAHWQDSADLDKLPLQVKVIVERAIDLAPKARYQHVDEMSADALRLLTTSLAQIDTRLLGLEESDPLLQYEHMIDGGPELIRDCMAVDPRRAREAVTAMSAYVHEQLAAGQLAPADAEKVRQFATGLEAECDDAHVRSLCSDMLKCVGTHHLDRP